MTEKERILELKKEAWKELDQIDGFYMSRNAVRRLDQRCDEIPKEDLILAPLLFIGDHNEVMKKYAQVIGKILYLNGATDSDAVRFMKTEELDWIVDYYDEIYDDDFDRVRFSSDVYNRLAGETAQRFGILYLEDSDGLMDIDDDYDRYPILSAIYGMAEQRADFLTILAGKLEGMRDLFLCLDAFDLYHPDQRLWFDDVSRYWKE